MMPRCKCCVVIVTPVNDLHSCTCHVCFMYFTGSPCIKQNGIYSALFEQTMVYGISTELHLKKKKYPLKSVVI